MGHPQGPPRQPPYNGPQGPPGMGQRPMGSSPVPQMVSLPQRQGSGPIGPPGGGSKRPAGPPHPGGPRQGSKSAKKKKKLADKILPQKVRELVPESQAYMDLLAFERKLDSTIMRKRLDIQEALKRPMKQKRKLRIFISNTTFPAKEGAEA